MNNNIGKGSTNPLLKAVKMFFSKFIKTPEEYPVKYYKKDKQYPRNRQQM
jgi:hypothetical protein